MNLFKKIAPKPREITPPSLLFGANPPGLPSEAQACLIDPKTYGGRRCGPVGILRWTVVAPIGFLARKIVGEYRLPGFLLTGQQQANRAFQAAARAGDVDRLRLLLAVADPRAPDGEGNTALMLAAMRANSAQCVEFLLPFSDPRAANRQGWTALMHAARQRPCFENLAALLPLSDPLALNEKGESALIIAAQESCWASAERLFPVSDPLAANAQGAPLLHILAEDLNPMSMVFFASRLRDRPSPLGDTALMVAARTGVAQKVRILLPIADARAQNAQGETALMQAAAHGSIEAVLALISASDCAARSRAGLTAFEMALQSEAWDCVDALCDGAPLAVLRYARDQLGDDEFFKRMPRACSILEAEELSGAAGLPPAATNASDDLSGAPMPERPSDISPVSAQGLDQPQRSPRRL